MPLCKLLIEHGVIKEPEPVKVEKKKEKKMGQMEEQKEETKEQAKEVVK